MKHLIVDSCCNISDEFLQKHQITLIGMPIILGERSFIDDHGKSLSHQEFYGALRDGEMASTSQINPDRFERLFHEQAPCCYLSFSSGMSGTFQNANLARALLAESKQKEILILDSRCASVGYGLLLEDLVLALDRDPELDVESYVDERRKQVQHFYTVDDLNYLKRGGRIPPAMAAIGSLLKLKPVMTMDAEGKLAPYQKVRGRKKAMSLLASEIHERIADNKRILIGHGDCEEEALELRDMIISLIPDAEITIQTESPTIGSHVGPGLLVVGFFGGQ